MTDPQKIIISLQKLKHLSWLNLDGRLISGEWQISDIKPLSQLVHLKELSLTGTQISQIEPLSNLTSLLFLKLNNNQIDDITPLSKLNKLEKLFLFKNKINNIAPLAKLSRLKVLDLLYNKIDDISPLAKLSNLEILILSYNQIKDIAPLAELSQLKELHLNHNNITDIITPLSKLKKLEKLYLDNNQIRDVFGIRELEGLKELHLDNNQINNIALLDDLPQLKELHLNNNEIVNIPTPFSKLRKLEKLYLDNNQIRDIFGIRELEGLKELHLDNNQINNIALLDNLPQLEELHLNNNKIVSIPAPFSKLRKLEKLYLKNNQICDISGIRELEELKKLYLGNNQIGSIVPVAELSQLKELYLQNNQIYDISRLVGLEELRELSLNKNQISDISSLETIISNLSHLNLRNNHIEKLPRWVIHFDGEIHKKQEDDRGLSLYENPIKNPPIKYIKRGKEAITAYFEQLDNSDKDPIAEARQVILDKLVKHHLAPKRNDMEIIRELEKLLDCTFYEHEIISPWSNISSYTKNENGEVTGCALGDIKNEILTEAIILLAMLPQLSSFFIDRRAENAWEECDLTPLSILTQLTSLYLHGEEITDIAPIKYLEKLETLNIANASVQDIGALEKLINLNSLTLSNNSIDDIENLRNLTQLISLDISYNQIDNIDALKNLSRLTSLYLEKNEIDGISSIKNLTQLTTLDIRSNKIDDISPIKNLTQLKTLDTSNNKIRDISPLANLKQLQKLELKKNFIRNIKALENLTQLDTLDLEENSIHNISPLANLTQLTSLNIRINQGNFKDVSPLANLTQLETLNLDGNEINDISPLKDLTQLLRLNLYDNQIKDLSPLKKLYEIQQKHSDPSRRDELIIGKIKIPYIDVNENPIEVPLPEIVSQGNDAIATYLSGMAEHGKEYLFEAKILVLGNVKAGKTSLVRKIIDENNALPSEEERTQGIDVLRYCFPLSKEKVAMLTKDKRKESDEFCLNLWDFGGQEIYKATHRFFLTKRSLYILVTDKETHNENGRDKGVDYWLYFAKTFGENSPILIVLNEKDQHKFNLDISKRKAQYNIVDVCDVDLAESNKTRLRKLVGEIQHQVAKLPHIGEPVPANWKAIRETLEKDSRNTIFISDYLKICKENSIEDQKGQLILSQYFHDIGVFLHFQNDPILKNRIFLKPNWATNAIYLILDSPLLSEQKGRFSKENANEIWSSKEFNFLHDELLELMKRFSLIYQIDNSNEYIVPEHLPARTPKYNWREEDNLMMLYHYDFFMPKGILSQFTVQINHYIANHNWVWKHGVVLVRDKTAAEIIESYDARQIKIRIAGKNQHNFMVIIREKIDRINAKYKKIDVKKIIPCNCTKCKVSLEPYFYDYSNLKGHLKEGQDKVQCGNSYEMVNVRNLIYGVDTKALRSKETMKRGKVFISYSHKDKGWLEKVQMHLKALSHLEIDFDLWDDTRIQAGDLWHEEIKIALAETDIAILLISTPFFASDFIKNEELPSFLKSAKEGGTKILPVIISQSIIAKTELGKFQAINDPAKPLVAMSESEQDKVLVKLAERIIELLE